ncbi:uncharacterized protein LOC117109876 [Anneissia japonica]|uniref:uncharacterized protein LOC117109876 n=1 Tax=Anneissia japonica TaxID=1529436 RepID=UPI00142588ED|nr:uncharacterized protein LOC117109876 [Anneissia japonica]
MGSKIGFGLGDHGEVCRNGAHVRKDVVSTFYTRLKCGRRSASFEPCQNTIEIQERRNSWPERIGEDLFVCTRLDEKFGASAEDKKFMELMSREMIKDSQGNWSAPLPKAASTIPRLELCAAVLATEVENYVRQELQLEIDESRFYSDSKVVLGYITNRKRRFHTYVCNRVSKIHRTSKSDQWMYVPTEKNPADQATRSIPATELNDSLWMSGPEFLKQRYLSTDQNHIERNVELLPNDPEVRPSTIACNKVVLNQACIGVERFSRFSSWESAVRVVTNLKHIARSFTRNNELECGCTGWHVCQTPKSVDERFEAENMIIKSVQGETFAADMSEVRSRKLTKSNKLIKWNPYIDNRGILRVGGRLSYS